MSYRRDITVGNIVPSALGGVASALALSYFGVAGSVIGAAVGPVVFLLVKELTRGPTEEVVARSAGRVRGAPAADGDGAPAEPATRVVVVRRRRDLALGALLATAAISALLAIALITIPELIRGESLVGSGRTTLFDGGGGGGGSGGGATGGEQVVTQTVTESSTVEEPATTGPGTTTTTTTVETTPPASTTAETVPTGPATTAPPAGGATDPATPPAAPAEGTATAPAP